MCRMVKWVLAGLMIALVGGSGLTGARADGWAAATVAGGNAAAAAIKPGGSNSHVALAAVAPAKLPDLSNDCRSKLVAGDKFKRPLRGIRRAVRENRNPRVLAIGSSTTVGVGASKPSNTYVAKLETNLETAFSGVDFDVLGRGMSGETAEGQSGRMKATVEEVKPDLVLWQVGTNDAIRHVDLEAFKVCLRRTLTWLADNKIDVMMVDPQYGDVLVKDVFYEQVVAAIAEVAAEKQVLLVDRFEAMRQLSQQHGDTVYLSSDQLHMNDTGHRCMAEQLARAIVAGVLQADTDSTNVAEIKR